MATIKGTVKNSQGQPLPGAAVFVNDGTGRVLNGRGVSTDEQGNFTIEAGPKERLTASFIGLQSQTQIAAGLAKGQGFTLLTTSEVLDEATVTAKRPMSWLKKGIIGASVLVLIKLATAKNPA